MPAQADETSLERAGVLQPTWPGRAFRGPDRGRIECSLRGGRYERGQAGSGLGGEQECRQTHRRRAPGRAGPGVLEAGRERATTGFPRCRPGSPAARPPRGAACLPDGTRSKAVGNVREACRSLRRSPPAARPERDRRTPGPRSGTRRLSTTLRLADSALALRNSLGDTV